MLAASNHSGVVHPSHHPLNVVTCWTKFLCAMSSTGYAVPLLLSLVAGEAAVMKMFLLLFSVGETTFTKVLFFFAGFRGIKEPMLVG